jgi:putative PIN family toxin of toxin-antitoxin system
VVLDTSVLLAGFGTHGLCETIVQACLTRHELFISEPILAELGRHLTGKFGLTTREAAEVLRLLKSRGTSVVPATIAPGTCRDATDLPILGTAQSAQADYLVSGDKDLLVLRHLGPVRIVSPRQFYEATETEGPNDPA